MACLRLLRTGRRNRARAACSAPQMCPGHIFCMCTHARAMQAACEAGRACMTEKPGHRRQQNQVTGLGPAGPPHAGPGVTPGVYSHSSVGCRAVAGSERAHAAAGPQTLPYVPGAQQAAPSALHYRQLLIKCACARLRGATAGVLMWQPGLPRRCKQCKGMHAGINACAAMRWRSRSPPVCALPTGSGQLSSSQAVGASSPACACCTEASNSTHTLARPPSPHPACMRHLHQHQNHIQPLGAMHKLPGRRHLRTHRSACACAQRRAL